MPLPPPPVLAPYPFLETVLNLARTRLNDAIASLGGDILTDTQPFTGAMVNGAWRNLQAFLANLGYSRHKKWFTGLAYPKTAALDPSVMNFLSWTQFFDGEGYYSAASSVATNVLPTYFRARGAVTTGLAVIALQVIGTSAQVAAQMEANEVASIYLVGGTALDIAVSGTFTGLIYFDVSDDTVNWYPYVPASIDMVYADTPSLPLPTVFIPGGQGVDLLPWDFIAPLRVMERQNNGAVPYSAATPNVRFTPMLLMPDGLPEGMKRPWNGFFNWEDDKLVFPGSLYSMDFKIEYAAYLADFITTNDILGNPNVDPVVTPANMPVPIMRSESALANYIGAEVAVGRDDVDAGTFLTAAEKDAKLLMNNSDVKLKQRRPVQRRAYAHSRGGQGFAGQNQGYN